MGRKMVALGPLVGLAVAGSAAGRVHTVRRGDTLEAIGRRYGVDVPTLVAANGLRNPDVVVEGAALKIPAPDRRPAVGPAASPASARRPSVGPAATPALARRPPSRAAVSGPAAVAKAGALRGTVVRMPPAQLTAVRSAPRIAVPPDRALASYYQGLGSVRERGPLDETQRFVANVKALRGRL